MVTQAPVTSFADKPFNFLDHKRAHPVKKTYRSTAVNTTFRTEERILGMTSTGTARTITIGSNLIKKAGHIFSIVDEGGGAASNNITVATEASENINGASTYVIEANREATTFYSNGSNLFILSSYLE